MALTVELNALLQPKLNALVGAALDEATAIGHELVDKNPDISTDSKLAIAVYAKRIKALTPASAQAAIDKLLRDANLEARIDEAQYIYEILLLELGTAYVEGKNAGGVVLVRIEKLKGELKGKANGA